MKDLVIGKEINERTVLVGLITQRQNEAKVGEYLDELEFLADTAGAEVCAVSPRNSNILTRAHSWGRASLPN